ncbi:DNA primase family protein [Limosilactobacillus agrestimuris]|uniref:DNA primase family protein n=1 Tax=Limosilactobacillus agrestimuris TaxID=2941331 RepID=UPI00203DE416|nr:phage/plasmid primase, P4 family [Limosilactobacillus agrestimuris]
MSKVLTNNSTASQMKEWALDPDRKVEPGTKPEIVAKAKALIPDEDDPFFDIKTGKRRTDEERKQQVQSGRQKKTTTTIGMFINQHEITWSYCLADDVTKNGCVFDYTEFGAAKMLSAVAKGHLIYDLDRQCWWIWDTTRWVKAPDNTPQIYQIVDQLQMIYVSQVESFAGTQYDFGIANREKDIGKFLKRLASKAGASAIVGLSKTGQLLGRSNLRYNMENTKLNVTNGEINLLTGELEDHKESDYFTQCVPHEYDPQAQAPRWLEFLKETFQDDKELISYVQYMLGCSLLGYDQGEKFFVLWGPKGRNGKSVLISAIHYALSGDVEDGSGFSLATDVHLFLTSKFGGNANGPSPALAQLAGKRFVSTTEPARNEKFEEGFIKSLTGQDKTQARGLNEKPFTLTPQFTLFIAANDVPQSDTTSAALMRRLVIIPFNHQIAANSLANDPHLTDELKKEAPGILTWLVQGCVKAASERNARKAIIEKARAEYQAGKITDDQAPRIYQDPLDDYPQSIKAALSIYRFGANSVTQFLFDRIITMSEFWNRLVPTALNHKLIEGSYSDDDLNYGKRYTSSAWLVANKRGWIQKGELYKIYQQYCKDAGINHPFTSKNFHDIAENLLVSANTNRGRCYLGITASPYLKGFNDYMPGLFSDAIDKIVKTEYSSVVLPDESIREKTVEELFNQLTINSREQLSDHQVEKIDKALSFDSDAYTSAFSKPAVTLLDPRRQTGVKSENITKDWASMFDTVTKSVIKKAQAVNNHK